MRYQLWLLLLLLQVDVFYSYFLCLLADSNFIHAISKFHIHIYLVNIVLAGAWFGDVSFSMLAIVLGSPTIGLELVVGVCICLLV